MAAACSALPLASQSFEIRITESYCSIMGLLKCTEQVDIFPIIFLAILISVLVSECVERLCGGLLAYLQARH
jgi:hypothetical protein